jgi:hypothetical protein
MAARRNPMHDDDRDVYITIVVLCLIVAAVLGSFYLHLIF